MFTFLCPDTFQPHPDNIHSPGSSYVRLGTRPHLDNDIRQLFQRLFCLLSPSTSLLQHILDLCVKVSIVSIALQGRVQRVLSVHVGRDGVGFQLVDRERQESNTSVRS